MNVLQQRELPPVVEDAGAARAWHAEDGFTLICLQRGRGQAPPCLWPREERHAPTSLACQHAHGRTAMLTRSPACNDNPWTALEQAARLW